MITIFGGMIVKIIRVHRSMVHGNTTVPVFAPAIRWIHKILIYLILQFRVTPQHYPIFWKIISMSALQITPPVLMVLLVLPATIIIRVTLNLIISLLPI